MKLRQFFKKILPKSLLNLRHLFFAWWGSVKYNHPSEELLVIGITGTSGKTSTIHFLRQILEFAGFKVGSLSTADFYIDGELKLNDKKMTMVGRYFIQEKLREMVDKKCDVAIVETTSEGYLQHRHKFINYDTMVLTNLYPEHLEHHGGFENYKAAKLGIFEYVSKLKRKNFINRPPLRGTTGGRVENQSTPPEPPLRGEGLMMKTAIVNGDSEFANEFLNFEFENKFLFHTQNRPPSFAEGRIRPLADRGTTGGRVENQSTPPEPPLRGEGKQISNFQFSISNFIAEDVLVNSDGLDFTVENITFHAPLYAEHNVSNLMAAISVAKSLDIEWEVIQKAVAKLTSPPGRIEFIKEAEIKGFKVIVDYAFEPVALASLYKVAELLKPKRIIHVCGSTGGGRDKARREPIGKLVGEKANIFIVTDEDPYDENPLEIIKTVSKGAQRVGKKIGVDLFEILDRREAIKKAIELAGAGDLILITGKGSEQAMCITGDKMIPWDDREIAREILNFKF